MTLDYAVILNMAAGTYPVVVSEGITYVPMHTVTGLTTPSNDESSPKVVSSKVVDDTKAVKITKSEPAKAKVAPKVKAPEPTVVEEDGDELDLNECEPKMYAALAKGSAVKVHLNGIETLDGEPYWGAVIKEYKNGKLFVTFDADGETDFIRHEEGDKVFTIDVVI